MSPSAPRASRLLDMRTSLLKKSSVPAQRARGRFIWHLWLLKSMPRPPGVKSHSFMLCEEAGPA